MEKAAEQFEKVIFPFFQKNQRQKLLPQKVNVFSYHGNF